MEQSVVQVYQLYKLRTHLMELSVQFSERRLSVALFFQETIENSNILTCCFFRHSQYEN